MKTSGIKTNYREDIDSIKGFSILAVMLFHYGLLRSGYLGVDAFFVINGFFIIPSVINGVENGSFSYFSFMRKRITRLYPLILVICLCALLFGSIFLLPFELERTARSVVACSLLSENMRCAFTFGDYWEILNDYSPLFHLWYVGILFEFYLLFPLLMMLMKKVKADFSLEIGVLFLFFVSLILYLLPFDSSLKFYLLPFRFFEIAIGGLVGIYIQRKGIGTGAVVRNHNILFSIALVLVIFSAVFTLGTDGIGHQVIPISPYNRSVVLTSEGLHFPPTLMLLLTVILTSVVLLKPCRNNLGGVFSWLGTRSYSLYIWHQFVLAFYRNTINDEITIVSTIVYFSLTIVLSEVTYRYVEQKIKPNNKTIKICGMCSVFIIIPSVFIYLNGGLIKDIPELELKKDEGRVGVGISYVDIPNKFKDKTFPVNGKKNVLVVGNSFARDFCNILRESKYNTLINYSYGYIDFPSNTDIISNADYIFCCVHKDLITDSICGLMKPNCKVYGIGTKNFGNSNNQFYAHRWSDDYFKSRAELPVEYRRVHEMEKKCWGESYIDLITPAMLDSIHVRVFTPDKKYISQDCRHLTKAGAKWYASVLDFDKIFSQE